MRTRAWRLPRDHFSSRALRGGTFENCPKALDGEHDPALTQVPYWDYHAAMRVIAVSHLRSFWEKYPGAEQALRAWLDEASRANWQSPADIKARYASASILRSRRVVFNIKGNDYRLVTAVAYRFGAVYVKFVGTHAEYDKIDADTVEME